MKNNKNIYNIPTENLNLDILKQVGIAGSTSDRRKEIQFVPSHSSKGRKQQFQSALVEKDLSDYTEDDLLEVLPESYKAKGFTVDPASVIFSQQEKYVAKLDELVTLTNFKFSVKPPSLYVDNEDVMALAAKAKSPKMVDFSPKTKNRFLLALVGDFQVGQADADGAEGVVNRTLQIAAHIKEEVRKNKVLKTPINKIVIATLGDLVEGVAYFYNTQTFAVTLDRREQVKVARRLFQRLLMDISALGIPIQVLTIGGNHGENRNVGGSYTTINDNDDVAIVEQIQESFALSPDKFGHIEFLFPEPTRMSLTVDILGHSVGIVHGHQVGSPRNLGASIRNYLNGQSRAKEAIGNVDYLFMGHFHHFYAERVSEQTTAVMTGAMCKGSDHFTQRYGLSSPPCFVLGVLTEAGDEGFKPIYLK